MSCSHARDRVHLPQSDWLLHSSNCVCRFDRCRARDRICDLAGDPSKHWRTTDHCPPDAPNLYTATTHTTEFRSLNRFGSRIFLTRPESNQPSPVHLIFLDLFNRFHAPIRTKLWNPHHFSTFRKHLWSLFHHLKIRRSQTIAFKFGQGGERIHLFLVHIKIHSNNGLWDKLIVNWLGNSCWALMNHVKNIQSLALFFVFIIIVS